MKKQLRILHLIDIPWHSGLTEYAIMQAEALRIYGHSVYFLIPKINPKFDEIRSKFSTLEVPDRKKILGFKDLSRITEFIKQNRIDILNAHTGRMQTLSFMISFLAPWVKILRTKSDAREIRKTFTYSKVRAIICGSKYIESMYLQKKIKNEVKTIYLSYNPIVPKPIPEKPYRITIVGRLDPVKGHYNFIKAAIEILKRRDDVRFMVVGKESNIKWSDLKSKIPSELEGYFVYLGYVENIYEIMAESHIGVISSTSSEAVSRVAIEWMNSARTVISSDVGCLPEIIDKPFIYPHNDWRILALKIEENLEIQRLIDIGSKNREKFLKLFSFERFAKLTNEVFENI